MVDKKDWMKDAVKKPGALRKSLGVKKGDKITKAELDKAAKSPNATTRKRAALAKTFKKVGK